MEIIGTIDDMPTVCNSCGKLVDKFNRSYIEDPQYDLLFHMSCILVLSALELMSLLSMNSTYLVLSNPGPGDLKKTSGVWRLQNKIIKQIQLEMRL